MSLSRALLFPRVATSLISAAHGCACVAAASQQRAADAEQRAQTAEQQLAAAQGAHPSAGGDASAQWPGATLSTRTRKRQRREAAAATTAAEASSDAAAAAFSRSCAVRDCASSRGHGVQTAGVAPRDVDRRGAPSPLQALVHTDSTDPLMDLVSLMDPEASPFLGSTFADDVLMIDTPRAPRDLRDNADDDGAAAVDSAASTGCMDGPAVGSDAAATVPVTASAPASTVDPLLASAECDDGDLAELSLDAVGDAWSAFMDEECPLGAMESPRLAFDAALDAVLASPVVVGDSGATGGSSTDAALSPTPCVEAGASPCSAPSSSACGSGDRGASSAVGGGVAVGERAWAALSAATDPQGQVLHMAPQDRQELVSQLVAALLARAIASTAGTTAAVASAAAGTVTAGVASSPSSSTPVSTSVVAPSVCATPGRSSSATTAVPATLPCTLPVRAMPPSPALVRGRGSAVSASAVTASLPVRGTHTHSPAGAGEALSLTPPLPLAVAPQCVAPSSRSFVDSATTTAAAATTTTAATAVLQSPEMLLAWLLPREALLAFVRQFQRIADSDVGAPQLFAASPPVLVASH